MQSPSVVGAGSRVRIPALAAIAMIGLAAACKTTPISTAQSASLNDPRMVCARNELRTLGYEVDESARRRGRIVATKLFPIPSPRQYRAAILAEVDSTDQSFDMWSRVLPPPGLNTIETAEESRLLQAPLFMVGDAMQTANRCSPKK
jgi:hypothetical protein